MSVPTYRVTSSKQLDNGDILIRCVTEDGKRLVKRIRIRPNRGGGVVRYAIDEQSSTPLDFVISPTSINLSGKIVLYPFRVSAATRVCEVLALARNVPHLRVVWPPSAEDVQPVHLNAAD